MLDPVAALGLDRYRAQIGLDEPFGPLGRSGPLPCGTDRRTLLRTVLAELVREGTASTVAADPVDLRADDPARARRLLKALLTIRPPGPLSANAERALGALLLSERSTTPVAAAGLPRITDRLALWRGDLTSLGADAVVNAANNQLLGCLIPFHRCIDNAFHAVAGPRMRADCAQIMRLQGLPAEPTGTAKATRGYYLSARFVLHTVGPIVRGQATAQHEQALADSYRSCLDLAAQLPDVRSVAFRFRGLRGLRRAGQLRVGGEVVLEVPGLDDLAVAELVDVDGTEGHRAPVGRDAEEGLDGRSAELGTDGDVVAGDDDGVDVDLEVCENRAEGLDVRAEAGGSGLLALTERDVLPVGREDLLVDTRIAVDER